MTEDVVTLVILGWVYLLLVILLVLSWRRPKRPRKTTYRYCIYCTGTPIPLNHCNICGEHYTPMSNDCRCTDWGK